MTQYVDHPDRLRSPRKRVGERGENKWQDISWQEAYDLIEEKMGKIREEHGAESMIFSMGTGRDVGAWICLLAYNYGSPNVMFALSGIGCYTPAHRGFRDRARRLLRLRRGPVAASGPRRPPLRGARDHRDLGLQHQRLLSRQHLRPLGHRPHEEGQQDHLHRSAPDLLRLARRQVAAAASRHRRGPGHGLSERDPERGPVRSNRSSKNGRTLLT